MTMLFNAKLKTLHARLLFIVLLATLPVLFMALFMTRDRYQEAKANAVETSRLLARSYAAAGKVLFDRAWTLLTGLEVLGEVRNQDAAACAQIFAARLREHPFFDAITLTRPDGRLVAGFRRDHLPARPPGNGLIAEVARTRAFLVGGYQQAGGEPPTLPLALPVPGPDGRASAVLGMSLDLRGLHDLLEDLPLPKDGAVSIIDRFGVILARFPEEPTAIGQPAPDADSFLPRLLDQGLGTWESVGVDDVERIYFLSPLLDQKEHSLFLRIGMPSAVAFAPARHELVRNLAFIAAMTVAAFLSSWFFSRSLLLRHIRNLWVATRKVSEGDYGHRIGVHGSDELAELAMAFDSMAGVLESKTLRLVTAERKYRTIFEGSVNGIFRTTPEGRFQEANPALARMLGYGSPREMADRISDIATQIYADPEVRQEVKDRLARDGLLRDFEFRARRADGEIIWLSLDVRTVQGPDGTPVYYEGMASDITARKRIEAHLQEKQEKLQALLDHSPALIAIKDAQGRFLLNNAAHREAHGLGQGVVGKRVEDLFSPEEARLIRDEDRQVLAGGKPLTFQRPLSLKGVPRHFMVVKFPLSDQSGRPDRVCSTAYDITDAEQVRAALRQSEEKYRTMVQTSPDLIWVIDPCGYIVEANNACRELLGYEPEELRGLHLGRIFHPEDVAAHERELVLPHCLGQGAKCPAPPGLINERRQMPRSTRNLAVRLRPKDGREPEAARHFELSSCGLWQNMAFVGSLAVIRDITERKRAEEKLLRARQELSDIFENAPVGIFQATPEGRYLKANMEMARILGYDSPQDLLHSVTDIATQVYADPQKRKELWTILAEKERIADYPVLNKRKDGTQIWTSRTYRAVKDPSGRLVSADGFLVDISERKALEALREDVDRVMRHDLKAPLNGIMNLPEIMMDDENLTEEQRRLLALISDSGHRMLQMINRSLGLYQMETGQYRLLPLPLDLLHLVRQVIAEMADVLAVRQLSVQVLRDGRPAGPGDCLTVRGEELLCLSLFENLLKNACEASPAGGMIQVDLSTQEPYHRVAIRNQGVVPRKIRDRFFDKYITAGKKDGSGLGTYSARMMAQAHGGDITMRTSEKDQETVVTVLLPC